jgi:hypothetical protein
LFLINLYLFHHPGFDAQSRKWHDSLYEFRSARCAAQEDMVEASLPGAKPEDASVSTMDDTLTIRYAKHCLSL